MYRCRCFSADDKYVMCCMCLVLCLLYVMLSSTCIFVYSKQDPPVTLYKLLLGPAAGNNLYMYLVWTAAAASNTVLPSHNTSLYVLLLNCIGVC